MQQTPLFQSNVTEVLVDARDGSRGDVRLYRHWMAAPQADDYLRVLTHELAWQQSIIKMHGRELPIPRLNAWYGDAGCSYRYSGIAFEPLPWTPSLNAIRQQLEVFMSELTSTEVRFNSLLANFYRDGSDSVAWHADDEPELGLKPLIASLSLGAERRFGMKPKTALIAAKSLSVDLPHGSLLIMQGETQHHWLHQLAKTTKSVEPRINLTFRQIKLTKSYKKIP